jgi:PiT family inorganic phosphate transporter
MPATFALNPEAGAQIHQLATNARAAAALIEKYGDDEKQVALDAVQRLQHAPTADATPAGTLRLTPVALSSDPGAGGQPEPAATQSAIRNEVYRVVSELKTASTNPAASEADKAEANRLRAGMRPSVEYAPWWVRVLSALCLGLGTAIGYKRIVHTLHLTPAQGASAELVGAGLIATAGFTGLPVSTTHIITSGIAGTMIGSRSGVNRGMLTRIALAWVFTLPITIAVSAALFYALDA